MLAANRSEPSKTEICASPQTAANRAYTAELEHRVRNLTCQLEAANQELESFAYSVSHDLRAPLRSIRGFSDALMERHSGQLDERGQEFLRRVKEASQQMDKLIEELVKFSRIARSPFNAGRVNLSVVAEAVAQELRQSVPNGAVQFVIAPNLWAYGDEQLLRLVLKHLLGNAWKFSSEKAGARIEVGATTAANIVSGEGSCSDRATGKNGPMDCRAQEGGSEEADAREPVFFVRDNGAGFDPANGSRLFGVFQRLHPANEFPGLGMGLAIVQHIIHRHGGRVWATGAPQQGATFYFTLPADQAQTDPA